MLKTPLLALSLLLPPALGSQEPEPTFAGRALREWIGGLRAPDLPARTAAARALKELGPLAAAAVPALIEALRTAEPAPLPTVREHPRALPPPESFAIPEFDFLLDGMADFRADVATALGHIGPTARSARPALVPLMRDPNVLVRRAAGAALGRLHVGDLTELFALLEDRDPNVREAAAFGLSASGSRADAVVRGLVGRLQDPDRRAREAATRALARMGPSAIPRLLEALARGDHATQFGAARVLATKGDAEGDVLLGALRKEDPALQRVAALALAVRGGASPRVTASLIETLGAPEAYVREGAAWALGWLRVQDRDAAEALLSALKDPAPPVRAAATQALAAILRDPSPRTARFRGALPGLLEDADPGVRRTAVACLGSEDSAALIAALRDRASEVRLAAARLLQNRKPLPTEVVRALVPALEDADPEVRAEACSALWDFRSDDELVIPALTSVLADENPEVRKHATWTLESVGSRATPAMDALIAALEDADKTVRESAANALGALGAAARRAVPALEKLSADPRLRASALRALARIDPGNGRTGAYRLEAGDWEIRVRVEHRLGAEDVPALIRALAGPDAAGRERAASLLAEIEPEGQNALVQAIRGGEGAARLAAARGAWMVEKPGDPLVEALLAAIGGPDAGLRRAAAEGLGGVARHHPSAGATWLRMLRDDDPLVRWTAAYAIWRRPGSQVLEPALERILVSDRPYSGVQVYAANEVMDSLARERWRCRDWSGALEAFEAWRPASFCGNAVAEMEHRRAKAIARCHFELGRPVRSLESLEPMLSEQRSDCLCLGKGHAGLLDFYVELAARAGRLAAARRRLETLPEWMKDHYRTSLDLHGGDEKK
jgi:HEAT repeat protein